MDYSYYNTDQTPHQFVGFSPDSNGASQPQQSQGFVNIPAPSIQQYDTPFETFGRSVYDTNSFIRPQLQHHRQPLQSLEQSPAPSISPSNSLRNNGHKTSLSESNIDVKFGMAGQYAVSDAMGDESMTRARSSSEERESLTPAQSKRKAQNRAAQRAFRERKERRVKELETRLNEMEQASATMHRENERLRQDLAKISTENEILRATSAARPPDPSRNGSHIFSRPGEELIYTGPMKYTPTNKPDPIFNKGNNHHANFPSTIPPDLGSPPHLFQKNNTSAATFYDPSASAKGHAVPQSLPQPTTSTIASTETPLPTAHLITVSPLTGQNLLSAGATWDYIQAHQLYKDGLVDIVEVSERLKGRAECDGRGPSFEETFVKQAIEASARAQLRNGKV